MVTRADATVVSRTVLTVRASIVAIAATAMILVPAAALDDARPSFFGWHMYAANVTLPELEAVMADGTTAHWSIVQFAAHARPEIDYGEVAAKHVCTRELGAISVRVERADPPLHEEYLCSAF